MAVVISLDLHVGSIGPLVATIAVPIMMEFHVTFQDVSLLTGYQLPVVGAVAPLVSALAQKYGKRPCYLVSTVFLLSGSILCAASPSYDAMLGGRLLQGVGTAAFESITFSAIGDLYFCPPAGLSHGILRQLSRRNGSPPWPHCRSSGRQSDLEMVLLDSQHIHRNWSHWHRPFWLGDIIQTRSCRHV